MRRLTSLVLTLAALPLIAQTTAPPAVSRALNAFSKTALAAHDRFLASDPLEGRGPGTRGDQIAEQYIAAQFESYGLEPAGDHGTYVQRVPLLGLTTDREKTSLAFTKGGAPVIGPLKIEEEYVGQNKAQLENDTLDSDVVFVGYGWQVVSNSWGSENSFTKNKPGEPALHFAGWITEKIARDLFKHAGLDLDALTKAAASRDFKPVPLGVKFSGTIATKIRSFDTANVVAKLPGSDPKLRDQAVLFSAHHDHLGVGKPDATGDRIYNGAIDNASGCAILLEMARVWALTNPAPKRSIDFAAVASEEQGLLVTAYHGE